MDKALVILVISNLPILFAAVYALLKFSKINLELRYFSGFLFLSATIQLISGSMFFLKWNNMLLLHIYSALGGFVLIQFYRLLFAEYITKAIFGWISILYLFFSIINSFFFESIYTFNSNALTIQSVILITLSLSWYKISYNYNFINTESQHHEIKSIQWVNSGILIYFASNLLLYYFGDYLMHSVFEGSLFNEIWMLHSLSTITAFTCFIIGLWKSQKL